MVATELPQPEQASPALHYGNLFGVHLKAWGARNVTHDFQLRLHKSLAFG